MPCACGVRNWFQWHKPIAAAQRPEGTAAAAEPRRVAHDSSTARTSTAELRDYQPHGVETQIFQNGELLAVCRFTVRALAVHWAEQKRAAILRSGGV